MTPKNIVTVDELIDHFGGLTATGKVFGASPQVVMRWRKRGALPARSFLVQRGILRREGVKAPPSLWGIAEQVAA